jgi:HEPN domain-containing protein
MAVELASKSVLLSFGMEYPKRYDVSAVFRTLQNKSEIRDWFQGR